MPTQAPRLKNICLVDIAATFLKSMGLEPAGNWSSTSA